MGGGQQATTQQVNKVELPAWVDQAAQENYGFAKQVADRPLQQYAGPTVADPSTMTTDAYSQLKALAGQDPMAGVTAIAPQNPTGILDATNPLYQQARDLYTQSAGPLDIQSYLNPYTQEVETRSVDNATRALQQQLAGISGQARSAGAFGGSRQAVQQGVAQAEGVRGIGDLTAQLRSQGFNTAAQLAENAATRKAGAAGGLLSTATGMTGAQTQQLQNLIAQQQQQQAVAKQRQDAGLTNIQALLGAGTQDQAQRQRIIDAAVAKFNEARDYPVEQLNTRLAALGMTPYGKTETGSKTVDTSSSPDFATLGLGALKAMLSFSDRSAKTDIEKVGRDPETGLDMYAYRYKSDPKTYPKVVGPMAQDVEKKYPKAVKKFSGKRVINLENLMEALA